MTQIAQMGEPQARQPVLLLGVGGGKRGKIAVGEGQHDDVARLLPEIDRLDQVVKARRAGLEQMHRSPGQSRLDRAAV